ncbi:MAG: hypothetical protein Q9221_007345 [Calogaya cf. arnoldii]
MSKMPPAPVNTLLSTLGLLYTLLASPVVAQTWTACNPLNTTDCPTNPALSTEHTYHFTNSSIDETWNATAGSLKYSQMSGAHFTIATRGDAPTIQSEYYLFGGELEAGKRERAMADLAFESERKELSAYQMQMTKGGFAVSSRPF